MKKLLGIGILLMVLLALVAVPAAAQVGPLNGEMPAEELEFDLIFDEAETEYLFIGEEFYERSDVITGNAFQGAMGITTVQQAAGNTSILESNVEVNAAADLEPADELELSAQEVEIEGVLLLERHYSRTDTISGNAFQNATGITTVNMSSGNANILQSNVEVNIGGGLFIPEPEM